MELVLQMKPEEVRKIRDEAQSSGLGVSDYLLRRLFGDEKIAEVEPLSHVNRDETEEREPAQKRMTPTMALMKLWLEQDATDDPEEIREAEEDLLEFKRNMNLPRKEAGARLHYPEVE